MNEPVPEPEMVTDVAVLAALGLDHADDALGAADVCNLEPNHLARASHPWREYVDAGGLMSYGIVRQAIYSHANVIVSPEHQALSRE
jgi:hypothetical protein